jgi:hypothetical protein
MRKPIAAQSFVALAFIAAASSAADVRLRAGNYETITTVGESTTAMKRSHCYTAAEASQINGVRTLKEAAEKSATVSHFTLKDYKLQGNTESYILIGAARSTMTTITYGGDSFETLLSSDTDRAHDVHMKGRRIGDCP